MSLARQHRDRILAQQTASAPASGSGFAAAAIAPSIAAASPAARAAAQIQLRLTHDLRRLKEIKSIDAKVAAKRTMLPEYRAWCDGLLEAGGMTVGNDLGSAAADEVLPTVMVWCMDVGDWMRTLELAQHAIRFNVAMPARYNRDAPTVVLEEIATAALKAQARNEAFPLWVLQGVEDLTADIDMHDEPRAKLAKAIGTELMRAVDALDPGTPEHLATASQALGILMRAQDLHDRIGVKGNIKRLEKALSASANEQAGTAPVA